MKRIVFITIISLVLVLSACGTKEEPNISTSDTPQVSDKISHTTNPTQETKVSENPKASESPVSEELNVDPNEYTGYG